MTARIRSTDTPGARPLTDSPSDGGLARRAPTTSFRAARTPTPRATTSIRRERPAFIVRGRGCHVWDVDGHEFVEYGMGLRAVTLGHAYPSVVEAAAAAMRLGTNFTRPSPLEVETARRRFSASCRGDMVKFAKNGSDATTAAVKLARAYTGRDLVAICRDQPFFSTDDWFIGTTPMAAGIPQSIRALTPGLPLQRSRERRGALPAISRRRSRASSSSPPPPASRQPGFLEGLRQLCDARGGALLVFDEMITGFRWHLGGAQTLYGVSARPLDLRQGPGQRLLAVGARRPRERSWSSAACATTTTGSSCSRRRTGPRPTLSRRPSRRSAIYEREGVVEILHRQGQRLREGHRGRGAGARRRRALPGRRPDVQPRLRGSRRGRQPVPGIPDARPPGDAQARDPDAVARRQLLPRRTPTSTGRSRPCEARSRSTARRSTAESSGSSRAGPCSPSSGRATDDARLELPRPARGPLRILCLGAHSDDIEIGCGGTIRAPRRDARRRSRLGRLQR